MPSAHSSSQAAAPHQGSSTTTGSVTTAASAASASELAPVHGTYSPTIDPANFVATIDNRYFPLIPYYSLRPFDPDLPRADDWLRERGR